MCVRFSTSVVSGALAFRTCLFSLSVTSAPAAALLGVWFRTITCVFEKEWEWVQHLPAKRTLPLVVQHHCGDRKCVNTQGTFGSTTRFKPPANNPDYGCISTECDISFKTRLVQSRPTPRHSLSRSQALRARLSSLGGTRRSLTINVPSSPGVPQRGLPNYQQQASVQVSRTACEPVDRVQKLLLNVSSHSLFTHLRYRFVFVEGKSVIYLARTLRLTVCDCASFAPVG